jgi:tetratricopeptide (TPR) repeat protein
MDIENVGAKLRDLWLCGLFTICIDCFDYLKSEQSLRHSALLVLYGSQLEKLRSRVLEFGQQHRLNDANVFHSTSDPGSTDNVQIRLTKIISHFLNLFKYVKKQELHQVYDEANLSNHTFIEAALGEFLTDLRTSHRRSSVIRIVKQVLDDQTECKDLYRTVQRSVDDLVYSDQKTWWKVGWTVPFTRNREFTTGNVSDMSLLQKAIVRVARASGVKAQTHDQIVAIAGPAGTGKTQLALDLVYQARKVNQSRPIFWVSGADPDSFRAGYLTIARQCGIPIGANIIKAVSTYLSHEKSGDWILVVDQMDDDTLWYPDSIGKPGAWPEWMIDELPRNVRGTIVITTRSSSLLAKLKVSTLVNMEESSSDRALLLFNDLAPGLSSSSPDDIALVEALEHNPLAIALAAAFLKQTRIPCSVYSKLLSAQSNDESTKELGYGLSVKGKHARNPVALAWKLSLEKVSRRSPMAIKLLCFMSCLMQNIIPVLLLPEAASDGEQENAIRTLQTFGFIGPHIQGNTIVLQSSVGIITQNWLISKNKLDYWSAKVAGRMSRVVDSIKPGDSQLWEAILPHAQSVASSLPDDVPEEMLTFLFQLAQYLGEQELFEESEVVFQDLAHRFEMENGWANERTIKAQLDLAAAKFSLDDYDSVDKLAATSLAHLHNMPESETKGCLIKRALILLAKADIKCLRYERVIKVLDDFLKNTGAESVLPDYHSVLMKRLVADAYVAMARYNEASIIFTGIQRSLVKSPVFSVKEQTRLLYSLANSHLPANIQEAAVYAKAAFNQAESKLGPHHPMTVEYMSFYGTLLEEQGKQTLGADLVWRSYKLGADVLLSGSEGDALVCARYGRTLTRSNQDLKLAQKILEYAYHASKLRLGSQNRAVWEVLMALGETYEARGNRTKALRYVKYVLQSRKRVLGVYHPSTKEAGVMVKRLSAASA